MSSNENTLLISGASGFLGRHIVEKAIRRGLEVRCTGRSATPPIELPNYRPADLTDAHQVKPLVESIDVVIHSAGLAHQFGKQTDAEQRFQQVNVEATRNIVQAAVDSGVKRFVLVSSVSVYGSQKTSPVPENAACRPVGHYAVSKWEAERVAIEIANRSNMQLTILRMATIYGAGDPGNVLKLVRAIDRGRFVWIGRGRNMKSLIHVEDAAESCLLAAENSSNNSPPRIYNVSAIPESMRSIVQTIGTSLGQPVRRWFIPSSLPIAATAIAGRITPAGSFVRRVNGTLTKWVANDAYDGSQFSEDFDFLPKTKLSDGIQREVDWYREAA